MQWVKLTLHFPSFFSYRIPDYSSQYAMSMPLPSPSTIKLGLVATAIRTTGNIAEGEHVFYAVRDADIRIIPPHQIVINTFLIRRLKKKKNPTEIESFERTFGVREYVFFQDDINLFVGCDETDTIIEYFRMLRYLGSGDSLLYVKHIEKIEEPPVDAIKPVTGREFIDTISEGGHIIYPVKDIHKEANFEQINPYSDEKGKNIFERKYYLLKAKVKRGKNWRIFIL